MDPEKGVFQFKIEKRCFSNATLWQQLSRNF